MTTVAFVILDSQTVVLNLIFSLQWIIDLMRSDAQYGRRPREFFVRVPSHVEAVVAAFAWADSSFTHDSASDVFH